jgi:methionyl-tRNA formyltransferase
MDVVEWPFVFPEEPEEWVGLTLHLMDEGVDTGPIICRFPVEIRKGDDFRAIRDRMEYFMPREVVAATAAIARGDYELEMQNEADGRQFFVMHPRLMEIAERRLAGLKFSGQ